MESIIVVGGGIAGLMAAYELSKQNKKVTLLEASKRLGGRIHTIKNNFSAPVELGAEFIHGNLPVTIKLLQKAGIRFFKVGGEMVNLQHGNFEKDSGEDYWDDLMDKMKHLKEDVSLQDFLIQYFNDDKYEELRASAKGYAAGFDLADHTKASTISLYNEWIHEESDVYRIEGGYQQLINYLESECKKNGCVIYTECCVKKISQQQNDVSVLTMCSRIFKADKIVVTVPLSALQSNKLSAEYIEFEPVIDKQIDAAKNIGFGCVVKIIIEFDEAFWQEEKKSIGFIFTDEFVPVWWTQLPHDNAILTGWIGGPKALALKNESNENILQQSIQSLSNSFNKSEAFLKQKIVASKVVNWINVKNIFGGYSYNTTKSNTAKELLQHPIGNTIFFAGEGIYNGKDGGTVEAALVSAQQAVEKILQYGNTGD